MAYWRSCGHLPGMGNDEPKSDGDGEEHRPHGIGVDDVHQD